MLRMKIMFFISLSAMTLHATIINVPNDASTIQAGINASVDGDTILVQPGNYPETINFNGKNIVVGSLCLTTGDTSFIRQTIIDGGALSHVVTFENNEDSTAQLVGFKIINGRATSGGGIYCRASSPKLSHLLVSDNEAHYGPGIYLRESSAIIVNTTIRDNESIHTYPYNGYGGGIYCTTNSNVTLKDLDIHKNQADTKAGGIYCASTTTLNITNCRITDNEAISAGGGICCWEGVELNLNNALISGNKSGDGGGGIFTYNSMVVVNNATIVNNAAYGFWDLGTGDKNKEGAGLYYYKGTLIVLNSIVAHNIGLYGLFTDLGTPQVWFCDFYDNDFGNFYNCGAEIGVNTDVNYYDDACDVFNNIQLDPSFVDYDNDNFHLADSSHCIGTGIETLNVDGTIYNALEYDIDNNPRPAPLGSVPDMGAFENNRDFAVPVELAFFRVSVLHNSAILHWQTLSESNNLGFFIERKTAGHEFETIGFVKGHGTSTETFDYTFEDQNLKSDSYSYRLKQQDVDGSFSYSNVQSISILPKTCALYQNYPNPFNSMTTIKYDIPVRSHVELSIYNLSGQRLETLVSEYQSAGAHTYQWDAENMASGLYIYRIATPDMSKSRRLLILK